MATRGVRGRGIGGEGPRKNRYIRRAIRKVVGQLFLIRRGLKYGQLLAFPGGASQSLSPEAGTAASRFKDGVGLEGGCSSGSSGSSLSADAECNPEAFEFSTTWSGASTRVESLASSRASGSLMFIVW
jgi:hypothetical protein